MGQANVNFNIDMKPDRSFIDLNDDVPTGFTTTDKLSKLLDGTNENKIGSLYRTYKDGVNG